MILLSLLLVQNTTTFSPGTPLALERIVEPNQIVQPVDLQVAPAGTPNERDLYVAERAGRIVVVSGGAVRPTPFVDVGAYVELTGDVGLRAFQFHPDYANNGQVFVWFDAPNGTAGVDGVLVRFTRAPGTPVTLDPASYTEILRIPQHGRSHGGGQIQFDADGMLILGIGDGEPGGDPNCTAQDPSNLLGAMLRIDVDGGTPYAIPPDNPFVGMAGYRPEILHYGLRHPWKWDIDEATGALWIGDVGQVQREEIDYAGPGIKGLNFGWSVLEGTFCFGEDVCINGVETSCSSTAVTGPAFEYAHWLGCSVTGAAVYHGSLVPEIQGRYVFTDFCSKKVFSIRPNPATGFFLTEEHAITRYPSNAVLTLSACCGVDADGEILFPDYVDGEIYRLAPLEAVEDVCAGAVNRVGTTGDLSLTGSCSIAADDLTFEVTGLPPLALGVLVVGPTTANVPLGNGIRCVGAGSTQLVRLDYRVSDNAGLMQHDVPIGHIGFPMAGVTLGSTAYFQTWYRDVNGPLGQHSNLSGAISVRFRP